MIEELNKAILALIKTKTENKCSLVRKQNLREVKRVNKALQNFRNKGDKK